ncbi:MAG: hypothetical protein IB618_00600 [Candidatus Pacearchaeota archaeon]|nr:MAG: hypothetical protein IB618_00600 [Candidatus Pacearchaeota archaeon]
MQSNKFKQLEKYGCWLLEEFDRTGKLPIGRKRIDITLDKKVILKLRKEAKRKNIALSRLIEEKVR